MDHVLRLAPRFAEEARATIRQVELEETGMDTFLTSFEEHARAEGQREILLRLLNRKVGTLAAELQIRVNVLSPETLLNLSEALFDFTNQEDLLIWLDKQDDGQVA